MENIYVLFNVDANVKKSTGILNEVDQFLCEKGLEHKTLFSESREAAIDFVHDLEANGGGKLIVVGGDGTIHNAINAIRDFEGVSVGFIRGGSGNDLASTLGISKDPKQAVNDILTAEERRMNLLDVGGIKCANLAATGLDVEVLKRRDRMKLFRGKAKYMVATLITLLKFGSYKINTVLDSVARSFKGMVIAVGNGKFFGGGMNAVPHANPFGDKFGVTVVNEIKKICLPTNLPRFISGKHENAPKYIEHFFGENLLVEAPEVADFTVDVDGELYTNIKFECTLLKNKLRVFVPNV